MFWDGMFSVKQKEQAMYVRDDSIKLGDKVRDRISGFSGVIVAITEWLNGCRRLTISPQVLHEGKPVDTQTFDAEQIEKIEAVKETPQKPHGGPSIAPAQRMNPGR